MRLSSRHLAQIGLTSKLQQQPEGKGSSWTRQTCGEYNNRVCFIQLEHNEAQGPIPYHCLVQETSIGPSQVEKNNQSVIFFQLYRQEI